jgi:fatty-acyl-CoA synthase
MTFKQKKGDLVAQGFDPAASTDAIWFDDPRRESYVRLDAAIHREIIEGEIRL